MEAMTKRTTILFPPKLYKRLERIAREQGRSVGELVREAVESRFGEGVVAARLQAIEALSRLEAPTGEPEEMEDDIRKGTLEQ
jgi:predicted DNA-binding protein